MKTNYMDLYITILEKADHNKLPETIVSDSTLIYQGVLDLIDMGYLTGSQVVTREGPVMQRVAITEAGQRFLARNAKRGEPAEGLIAWAVKGQLLASLAVLILFVCFVVIFEYFRF